MITEQLFGYWSTSSIRQRWSFFPESPSSLAPRASQHCPAFRPFLAAPFPGSSLASLAPNHWWPPGLNPWTSGLFCQYSVPDNLSQSQGSKCHGHAATSQGITFTLVLCLFSKLQPVQSAKTWGRAWSSVQNSPVTNETDPFPSCLLTPLHPLLSVAWASRFGEHFLFPLQEYAFPGDPRSYFSGSASFSGRPSVATHSWVFNCSPQHVHHPLQLTVFPSSTSHSPTYCIFHHLLFNVHAAQWSVNSTRGGICFCFAHSWILGAWRVPST